MKKSVRLFCFSMPIILLLFSCASNSKKEEEREVMDIRTKVDKLEGQLKSSITEFSYIMSIDHSRLAEEAGVYTPPSIVTLFSNPMVNSQLISKNPLTGLDLPYKVLCYSEPDTVRASIAYTSATFLQKRHGLGDDDLQEFSKDVEQVVNSISESEIEETNLDIVVQNYGIIELNSDFDFETTILKLKDVVNAQSDTKWFGEIDFQEEARDLNIDIDKTTLLLFGGPAPGGQAMFDSPRLGLDAFCQKLLVFENEAKQVIVALNDIPAFAELYYNRTTKPQELINNRLLNVFTMALSDN